MGEARHTGTQSAPRHAAPAIQALSGALLRVGRDDRAMTTSNILRAALATCVLCAAACKPERAPDLTVQARVTVLPGAGPVRVRLEVDTAPNAEVDAMNLTIANDRIPRDSPMLFPPGQRADAQGHWRGEVELSGRAGPEQTFSVNVEAQVPSSRPFSHRSLRALGRTTVSVAVPFRLYTDPERHTLRAAGPTLCYARLAADCRSLSLHGLPAGSTFRFNGAAAPAAGGVATLPFPALQHISAVRTNAVARPEVPSPVARVEVDATVEVQLADGSVQRATHRLSEEVRTCAMHYLASVRTGTGVPMQPEGDASVSMVIPGDAIGQPSYVGPTGPLSNVRVVVMQTSTRQPFGCGAYRSASGRVVASSAERETLTLVAYERRTGATLGRQTLVAPPPRCFTTVGAAGGNALSSVPREEVFAWVRGL